MGFLPATGWALTLCAMTLLTPSSQHSASGLGETAVPSPPSMSASQLPIQVPSHL